jgi:predicted transcriptional regulator
MGSPVEEKILAALLEGEMTAQELERKCNCNRRTIYRAIDRLVGFVHKRGRGKYALTPLGEVVASKALEYIELKGLFERHISFWISHDLYGIPRPLLRDIAALYKSHIVRTGVTPDKAVQAITEAFKNAREAIIGISPIVTLEWAKAIVEQADRGIKVSLITTENVLEMQREEGFKDYSPLEHPNIDLMINNNIRLAFMSNMESIALALFNDRGLDIQNILVCKDPKAVEWGKRLFEYYKTKSRQIFYFND